MVIVVRYSGATLLRSLMKNTKAAPIEMYPTKNKKKVNNSRVSLPSPSLRKEGRPESASTVASAASAVGTRTANTAMAVNSRAVRRRVLFPDINRPTIFSQI